MAISLLMLARRRERTIPMAYAEGRYSYGEASGNRVVSAGLAIGIAGAVGSALVAALAMPSIGERMSGPIVIRNIPAPQPIEQERRTEPEKAERTAASNPTRVRPIIDVPAIGEPIQVTFDANIYPPADPMPGDITGGVTIADPVQPAAEPVYREASRDPRFARSFQPAYPPALEREGVVGTVRVRVRIGTDGRVISVVNLDATDPAFFAATERQALRHWRFRPATRDGVPVESEQTLTVRFEVPPRD